MHPTPIWIAWLALAFVSLATAAIGIAAYGRSRWTASTQALIGELEATRQPPPAARYDARELEGLPAPVQRYFRAALKDGQPIVTAATIDLAGSFNLSPTSERWKPFTSMQRAVTRRPGFVWDGHVALAPGIAVHVHDAYIAGVGILKPSVLGLYALADVRGGGEIARDELMRYFAEAAWYPTALLPSQGVRWEAVDDRSANATLVDGGLSVTMRVAFDSAGMIESSRFEARGAMNDDKRGNKTGPTPWEGRWSDYQERHGMRLPMTGEAAWLPSNGRKPYFRGSVTALVLEFAR
jgi:hypothetical protein